MFKFCLCIFENDTIKNDCPIQIFLKIMKNLILTVLVYLTSFTVCSRDIFKKKL